MTYAASIEEENPSLARGIRNRVKIYERKDKSLYVYFNGRRFNVGYGVYREYEDCIFKDNVRKRLYYK